MRQRRRNCADIGIAINSNENAAILESLRLIHAGNLINSNDVVVITPNWVLPKGPETADTVGQESLRTVIRFAKENNPRRIVVATGSAGKSTAEVMNQVGYEKIIQEEQVEFVDLNHGPFTRISLNHNSPNATNLNKLYDEMTFLISFAQLKLHSEATITAAIKNIALGWPPTEEHGHPKKNLGIHNDLHGFIRAMAEKIPIDLSIVSANPAMIGTGPHTGIPKHTGIVISGTDPVAVDTVGARLLGFKNQAVRYLWDLKNINIGIGDVEKMNIQGLQLSDAEKAFSLAAYGQEFAVE
ncbi:MAG TPA: DUF362 domain-containing protein [Clostridiaceae bacterium]|nr:DUF362 domain-containing protein [Clostridiaceae bacterium]